MTTTYPNCNARDAAGVLLTGSVSLDDVLRALRIAHDRKVHRIAEITVQCVGYIPGADEYHAGTALYRITL